MILALIALAAQAAIPEDRFAQCAALAQTAPEQAVAAAEAWRIDGGGVDARQCLGLAYVGQARWAPAAAVYEQAAREAAENSDPRLADLWVQAANAWIAADEPTRAIEALDAALATGTLLDELRGEVHLDRARALVALDNPDGARAEIDQGLALVPDDPFGWYLSAALAQRQGQMERAGSDIARALEMAPDDPDILLFAGTVAGLNGDFATARRHYEEVMRIAPDSAAAQSARTALAE